MNRRNLRFLVPLELLGCSAACLRIRIWHFGQLMLGGNLLTVWIAAAWPCYAQIRESGECMVDDGEFKVQEDKKHRDTYQAIADSEEKLQFFAARQIACRLLGSRGYLCQKDFLRQNNTGKLLWQVFGIQSTSLCLFGIHEHEEIMWDTLKSAGKDMVWCLYPNKRASPKSVQDVFSRISLTSGGRSTVNTYLNMTRASEDNVMHVLKEHWRLLWGDDCLPCICLSMPGVSVMHKLRLFTGGYRPQPAWDHTCTAAAAIGLLSELHLHPAFSSYGLDKQAAAVENGLVFLLDALTTRRLRMGSSFKVKKFNHYLEPCRHMVEYSCANQTNCRMLQLSMRGHFGKRSGASGH
ncbi:hypothetical protein ACLOJK_009830 [Asimina triloba]